MNIERHLLLRAIAEINGLRRSNEILGAKVEVMELFGMALRAQSGNMNCMSEDIVWRMQERVDEIAVADGNSRTTDNVK